MPYVKGDFYLDQIKMVAGSKYFALEKPNDGNILVDVCGIVIGSTWC